MSTPNLNNVHIDVPLTNLTLARMQKRTNFIADRVFPRVPSPNVTDKYYTFGDKTFFQDTAVPYSADSAPTRLSFQISNDSFTIGFYPVEVPLDAPIEANADAMLNLSQVCSETVANSLLIGRERAFMSSFFTTGVWTTDVVGGTDFVQWSNPTSDPQKDVFNAQLAIEKRTGVMPNKFVVSPYVDAALRRHPMVKDQFKFTSAESITDAMLARFFNLPADGYMVARAIYDTAAPGFAFSGDFIAGKNALLCYSAPAPGLMTASAGYTFVWSNWAGGGGLGIETYVDRRHSATIYRAWLNYGFKVTGQNYGYFFSQAVA